MLAPFERWRFDANDCVGPGIRRTQRRMHLDYICPHKEPTSLAVRLFVRSTAAVLVAPPFAAPPYVDLVKVVVGFALLFWLHVSLALACLWVAKQFRFSYAYAASDASTPWQLSMLQLLVVTTVMAVTLGLYTKTHLFEGKELALVSLWCVNNAVLAACGVMCRSIKHHIALRFAILVAVAIGSCVILHILFTALGSVRQAICGNL